VHAHEPSASSTSGEHAADTASVPGSVHEALRRPGRPLDVDARRALQPTFGGCDLSRVRVHAYGSHVVFGRGQYAPSTTGGAALLAHEVAHAVARPSEDRPPQRIAAPDSPTERAARAVAAAPTSASAGADALVAGPPGELKRDEDPTAGALYPTGREQEKIRGVLGPDVAEPGPEKKDEKLPALTDPEGFTKEMLDTFLKSDNGLDKGYIDRVLPGAIANRDAKVKLDNDQVLSLADIADAEVRKFFGKYIPGAALKDFKLRDHTHFVEPTPGKGEVSIEKRLRDWLDSRMQQRGGAIIEKHHVFAGDATNPGRDQKLWDKTREAIITARKDDLDTIVKFLSGFHLGGEAFVQPRIPAKTDEKEAKTRRRGRWETLQTLIHEMMHAMAHDNFRKAVGKVEHSKLAVEGFAEYFARQVYATIVEDATLDPKRRAQIEGDKFEDDFLPPRSTAYEDYIDQIDTLKSDWLGATGADGAKEKEKRTNSIEESLRVAYFLGRVEYLGLGSWTRAKGAQRFAGNVVAGTIALDTGGAAQLRARYGRIVVGRDAPFKFDVGPSITYLTSGDKTSARFGGGIDVGLRYEWPHVYLGARAGLEVSGKVGDPRNKVEPDPSAGANKFRVDILPGIEFRAKIGVVNVGLNTTLLIPISGGSQFPDDKKVRPFFGGGLSAEF
jgi:Domain of unknown function (DUF4157)